MRNSLKYGVPALVGLGAAGAAAAQDENPLGILGAGSAAALGGAAGLLGARALAGKYSPQLMTRLQEKIDSPRGNSGASIRERTEEAIRQSPEYRERGPSKTLYDPQSIQNMARTALLGAPASINASAPAALGAILAPTAGAVAGLGGMAAGQGVTAVGQMLGIDPEAPGSSNTMGSRLSMQSTMLPMY